MKYADDAVHLLAEYNLTIASAESCTGGMIASELVNYPGISAFFNEGYVTYSNEAKQKLLNVKEGTLIKYGAVSEQCAREMAQGVLAASGSKIGIATTGIAGPDGGSEEKPVGTVYIACAYKDKVITRQFLFSGSRMQVRFQATKMAFKLIMDTIYRLEYNDESHSGQ